ncbi:hypothetical protein [Mycobacterium sp. RTGN5]|uniref:hypothetical protein n=1 Tax=Mycobacterium sp. RTGN5 TaxID=3016522 RepID=UPI0029C845B9|nr:hypothetical protein [Mycobacterium sp. RTGN5]
MAVMIVAGVVSAPVATAEPSPSDSGSTESAGSSRSANDSSPKTPSSAARGSKAATEAKAWQDLEVTTAKQADELTAAEAKVLETQIAQTRMDARQRRDELRSQLDPDYQAQIDAVTQQENDTVGAIQDRAATVQQLSSAQSALALEMSDAADEAAVLAALGANDTAALKGLLEQSANDRQAMIDAKRSLVDTLADQTRGNSAVAQGISQIMNGLGAMESLQQYNSDETKAILAAQAEAQAEAQTFEGADQQADLVQQMMDLQRDIRDKMMAIETANRETMQAISRNI